MTNEEFLKLFKENVEYLRGTIAPDDIYDFSEQMFMMAAFFLYKLHECVGLADVVAGDSVAKNWINYMVKIKMLKDSKQDFKFNLCLDIENEDDN